MDELISYMEPKKVFMHELISYIEPKKVFMYELISYIEPYMGQFLQGGKNGHLMSFFFKSRASV